MMSRITLNLKKFPHEDLDSTIIKNTGPVVFQTESAWPNSRAAIETNIYRNPVDW